MAWAIPAHTRSQSNRAGDVIVKHAAADGHESLDLFVEDFFEYSSAREVINNWRASHQYPLNTFQMTLRRKARKISNASLVSRRLKRFESIERKLCSGTINLTQMQDIGGCRAVLPNLSDVYNLRELYRQSQFEHVFNNEKYYIKNPKIDGYRSLQIIYKYKGNLSTPFYDGLQIEIQIRSQRQHAWATAVEAVSIFTKQALKWRGGSAEWQKFFLLMSNAIALMEGADNVSAEKREIAAEIRILTDSLMVQNVLKAYRVTLNYVGELEERKAKLMLVQLNPDLDEVRVQGFRIAESQTANAAYANAEKNIGDNSSSQAVLVRVESIEALKRAYPNYFLDTELFTRLVDQVLKW